jgi:pimeloyl-ACP methyl ester carboxylesterase
MKQEILGYSPKPTKGQKRPPLLFIHGANGGAWMWSEKFLGIFAAKGYPAYALSLRGHGGSEGDLNSSTFANYLEDIEKAVALIEAQPVLIGHSMGGLAAQHYVGKGHPVKALILLASVPPSGLGSAAMHMMLKASDVLWQLGLLQSFGSKAVSPQVLLRGFFARDTPLEAVADLIAKLQPESPIASAELLSPPPLHPLPEEARPPVLVLGGEADVFMPPAALHENAFFWKADLETLAGAPHALMLDPAWWQITAEKILTWLKAKKI